MWPSVGSKVWTAGEEVQARLRKTNTQSFLAYISITESPVLELHDMLMNV